MGLTAEASGPTALDRFCASPFRAMGVVVESVTVGDAHGYVVLTLRAKVTILFSPFGRKLALNNPGT